MPRRTFGRMAAGLDGEPLAALPAESASASSSTAELSVLRTHWKWAAFSQFFYTFAPMLAMDDLSLNDIEDDLAHGNNIYLPRVMQRLLYTLSYDRKVSPHNWQTALRKQYHKRDPTLNPIGPGSDSDIVHSARRTESLDPIKHETPAPDADAPSDPPDEMAETKDWNDLGMLEKLDSMHLLMEWQFHNSTRLRTLMKTDDDYATWRIEPVGYDAKMNSYWLIGERLWIQREPPKPPRGPKTLKRKRPPPKSNGKRAAAAVAKRARIERAPAKGKTKAVEPTDSPAGRHIRAAKSQANLKLDAQAKELEELNQQAASLARGEAGLRTSSRRAAAPHTPKATSSMRSLRTRTSARLRGDEEDEEWQAVPDDWLKEGKKSRRASSAASSISELTELSESDDESDDQDQEENEEIEPQPPTEEEDDSQEPQSVKLPDDFVEWETICVTLHDWETVAQRWENATHYTEKAFYKVLTKNIVPVITEELKRQEAERRKLMVVVEPIATRKRSSRIAIKESSREEAKAAARQKADDDGRNGRAKRAEARQQKEEEARQERERMKEEEQREREAQDSEAREPQEEDMEIDIIGNGNGRLKGQSNGRSSRSNGRTASKAASGSQTPVDSEWDLDCEICHRHGPNLDGEERLVSCNSCGKWQHIQCHDHADRQNGMTIRNWEKVDFFCKRCIHTSYPVRTFNVGGPLSSSREQYLGGHPTNYPPRPTEYYPPYQVKPYPSSDVRSNGHGHTYSPAPPKAAKTISFNHYQPQQQGFAQFPGTTQTYGQMASASSSGRYPPGYAAPTTGGYSGDYSSVPNGRYPPSSPPSHSYTAGGYPHTSADTYSDAWPPTQKISDPYAATINYRPSS